MSLLLSPGCCPSFPPSGTTPTGHLDVCHYTYVISRLEGARVRVSGPTARNDFQEFLLIDDSTRNCEAARALGMEVVLWKSDQASHDALHSVLESRYGLDIDFNVKERQ